MENRPLSSFSARDLSARLVLLSLLVLGACSNQDDDMAGLSGLQPGPDGGASSTVPMVPGPEQRNDADAGVTKPEPSDDTPQSFESDLTGTSRARGGAGGLTADGFGAAAPTAGATNAAATDSSATAERAIVEADIVQVAGNTLYALSQYGGLSVIDIADPAKLRLLGSYRELSGTPFEMYLRDSVAVVMFTSWGQYEKQADDSYKWIQTSKIVALDTADPAHIKAIGSFDIAGEVSDSRVVGDIMYVVGYQNGYCWGCTTDKPLTAVLSLDIKNPRAIQRVDSLQFAGSNDSYGGGKRSISVTTQRIYIAGPEYGQQPTNSTIQVVDISDAGGELVEGTTVTVAGQITNRWQLDEYQNVLRVISQPWPWTAQGITAPVVQTYTVASAQQLTALGRSNLQIPPNETLMSVRFDGPRGYAITAQRTDPLFTIDLSDPAKPRQVGELVMPGWVYYMEPRGNRLIGLGYDQNNPAGGITVSIFDVEDLAEPRMLSRVNFGGTWAYLPEDQDRIHKAFKVLDQQGLILVPFSGWSNTVRGDTYCSGTYRSGIQLVDFQGDTLTARGVAPSRGQARRAIVNGSSLLAVSDEAVDAFDITNRASPSAKGRLTIAQNVTSAMPLSNGYAARISQDWYGQQRSSVDIVALADVDRPDRAVGELDLSHVLSPDSACSGNAYIEQAFASGNEIDLLITRWDYSEGKYTTKSGVVVVDAADPKAPKLASKLEWQLDGNSEVYPWYGFSNYYDYGFTGAQQNTVRSQHAIVKLEQRWVYDPAGSSQYDVRVNVVDLTDPENPSQTTLALPKASGYAGLVQDGNDVLFSHYDESENGTRARFYIDRIDLSDPKNPKLTDKVSVPGALLHHDRANGRAVTSELTRRVVEDLTNNECWQRFGYAEWAPKGSDGGIYYGGYDDKTKGTCTGYVQHLHLVRFVPGGAVLDSSYHLDEGERISASSLGEGRVTAVLNHGFQYFWGIAVDCFNCGTGAYYGAGSLKPAEIVVLGGLADGTFEVGRLTVEGVQNGWWGFYGSPPVYAAGKKALVQSSSDVAIVDTSVPSAPKLVSTVPLFGYPQSLKAAGNLVLLALGMNGVQRIDL